MGLYGISWRIAGYRHFYLRAALLSKGFVEVYYTEEEEEDSTTKGHVFDRYFGRDITSPDDRNSGAKRMTDDSTCCNQINVVCSSQGYRSNLAPVTPLSEESQNKRLNKDRTEEKNCRNFVRPPLTSVFSWLREEFFGLRFPPPSPPTELPPLQTGH